MNKKELKELRLKRKIVIITSLCIIAGAVINIIGNANKVKPPYDITTKTYTTTIENKVYSKRTTKKKTTKKRTTKASNGKYKLTHYGPNCKGCSGVTASGYNVKKTIFYNDSQYGRLRICATSKQFKMYSIIKLKNYKLGEVDCIVLDRGVGSGVIDLLVNSEKIANKLGIQKVNIEVIRNGK